MNRPRRVLTGRRVQLRPLAPSDYPRWREVRQRAADWLLRWEPRPPPGAPSAVEHPDAFAARCGVREREWHLGTAYAFGIFVHDRFVGEINLSAVQRGPFQNAYVGYWVDEACAGQGYVPEALVMVAGFAFEELGLHRLQVAIIPRNQRSRRVVEKVGLREEGVARRYLQIDGVWEDHLRYALTAEEWAERRDALVSEWVSPCPGRDASSATEPRTQSAG